MRKIVASVLIFLPLVSVAEILPPKGDLDDRVRLVDYHPLQVYRINTQFGAVTDLRFGDGEIIEDKELGDSKAWAIRHKKNYMILQPIAEKADTNLVVFTNKRTYRFALIVEPAKDTDDKKWRSNNLVYSLIFRYPQDEVAKQTTAAIVASVKAEKEEIKGKLAANKPLEGGQNFDYWVAGSQEISPTSARDNGRFIYLTFSGNREMPSIHEVNEKGEEALVKTTVTGSTLIVEKLARHLILRKGELAACVINKSYDIADEKDNESGTSTQEVVRVVREPK